MHAWHDLCIFMDDFWGPRKRLCDQSTRGQWCFCGNGLDLSLHYHSQALHPPPPCTVGSSRYTNISWLFAVWPEKLTYYKRYRWRISYILYTQIWYFPLAVVSGEAVSSRPLLLCLVLGFGASGIGSWEGKVDVKWKAARTNQDWVCPSPPPVSGMGCRSAGDFHYDTAHVPGPGLGESWR